MVMYETGSSCNGKRLLMMRYLHNQLEGSLVLDQTTGELCL